MLPGYYFERSQGLWKNTECLIFCLSLSGSLIEVLQALTCRMSHQRRGDASVWKWMFPLTKTNVLFTLHSVLLRNVVFSSSCSLPHCFIRIQLSVFSIGNVKKSKLPLIFVRIACQMYRCPLGTPLAHIGFCCKLDRPPCT